MFQRQNLQISESVWGEIRIASQFQFFEQPQMAAQSLFNAAKVSFQEGAQADAVSLLQQTQILDATRADYANTLAKIAQQGHEPNPSLSQRLQEYFVPKSGGVSLGPTWREDPQLALAEIAKIHSHSFDDEGSQKYWWGQAVYKYSGGLEKQLSFSKGLIEHLDQWLENFALEGLSQAAIAEPVGSALEACLINGYQAKRKDGVLLLRGQSMTGLEWLKRRMQREASLSQQLEKILKAEPKEIPPAALQKFEVFLKTFGQARPGTGSDKATNLPEVQELIDSNLTGIYAEGFLSLWSVKEQEIDWEDHVEWHHFIPTGSTLIGTSAFGDLIFITPMGFIQLLLTETGESSALPKGLTLEMFLNRFIAEVEAQEAVFKKSSFERWQRENGELADGNVVIFAPYLGLGGSPAENKLSDGLLVPYLALTGSMLGAEVEITSPETYLHAGNEVQQMELWEKAFEYYELLAGAMPEKVAESCLLQAICLDKLMDFERAIAYYDRVVSLGTTPENMAMAHGNVGLFYAQSGELDKAIERLNQAIEHNAGYSKAYANLSFCYIESGRTKEAEKAARACLAIDPNDHVAQENLQRATGQWDESKREAFVEKAESLSNEDPHSKLVRRFMYDLAHKIRRGDGKPKEWKAEIDKFNKGRTAVVMSLPEGSSLRSSYETTIDQLDKLGKFLGKKKMVVFSRKKLSFEEQRAAEGVLIQLKNLWPYRDVNLNLLSTFSELWGGFSPKLKEIALEMFQGNDDFQKMLSRAPEQAFADRAWVGGTYVHALMKGIPLNQELVPLPGVESLEAYIQEHEEAQAGRIQVMNKLMALMPEMPAYDLYPNLVVNWIVSEWAPGCEADVGVQPSFNSLTQVFYAFVDRMDQEILSAR